MYVTGVLISFSLTSGLVPFGALGSIILINATLAHSIFLSYSSPGNIVPRTYSSMSSLEFNVFCCKDKVSFWRFKKANTSTNFLAHVESCFSYMIDENPRKSLFCDFVSVKIIEHLRKCCSRYMNTSVNNTVPAQRANQRDNPGHLCLLSDPIIDAFN